METAYHMFRDHPNFQNIVFYIHPLIRENIMTSADIPEDITVNLDTYGALFPRLNLEYFPRTVSDELDNLYYARNFLPHLAERVSGLNKKKTDEVICTEIRERFPKSIEAFHFTKSRVEQMKAFFKEFIKDSKYFYPKSFKSQQKRKKSR
uniref:Uncharacterized protein n=1 Tax=Euplotes harpa TaxID=151035 RepID=A0A7S3JCI5_9SPIT|mmetsp:Transcript_29184/g.33398  ORF Transcript_29184/g.33398 Transcript_29184/m.33398 type:complete len:150 (+) Transcript_29184:421-870(+)